MTDTTTTARCHHETYTGQNTSPDHICTLAADHAGSHRCACGNARWAHVTVSAVHATRYDVHCRSCDARASFRLPDDAQRAAKLHRCHARPGI